MITSTPVLRFTFKWRTVVHALLACTLLIGLAGSALSSEAAPTAITWYVAITGNDNNTCQAEASACRSIRHAIEQATSGDTIIIGAGTFYENLDISADLTLQGDDQLTTIIDGQGLIGSVMTVNNATVNLSDLTVRNGKYPYGAGLYIYPASAANLINSRVIDNVGQNGGGGILNQGRLTLTNVSLSNNVNLGPSDRGGGLLNLGTAELINSTVADNQSLSNGGGGIGNRGVLIITGGTLSGNQAGSGGAIYNEYKLTLNATLISRNEAKSAEGGGIFNAGLGFLPGDIIDSGSVITENVAATSGGGVHNASTGNLVFNGTRIVSNTSSTFGGGLYSGGTASLTAVSVQDNRAVSGGGLYSANTTSILTINQGEIINNQSAANGGGLYSDGTTSLTAVNVKDNRAVNGSGGGLYSANTISSLTINQGQIINNQSAANGGGLLNNGTASLSGVSLINNRASNGSGGGVYNAAGQLTLAQSELNDNVATISNGGGLFNAALANLNQVRIQNNQSASGGGLYNDVAGELEVVASTVYLNSSAPSSGGGINNHGTLTLMQSAVYSNSTATQGGSGLYNAAASSAQLTNITLSYNAVLSSTTGAILNEGGTLNVLNSTISHNRWPALVRTGGTLTVTNTIIANSTGGVNCNGTIKSDGHNLDSGSSCGLSATGDISNTDPLLGPLSNNGGSTLTRSLLPNSPALDAGHDTQCPGVDQRGVARPQGDHCDIGAYEVIGYSNSITQTVAPGSCISSALVISSSYLIGSLHIGANVTFAPREDLRVKLYAPNNTVIQLLGATSGSGQNLDVLWDDDSPLGPVGGAEDHDVSFPFYNYVRVPDHSLTPLFGRSLRGAWRLEICNVSSVLTNTATLNRWSVIVPSFGNPRVFLPLIRR